MTAITHSVALVGIDGTVVEVEAAVGGGLPRTILVGLPDASLHEAKDRCKAAVQGCGLKWPDNLLTINLSPAALPKSGTHYDLAIVAAVMIAQDTQGAAAQESDGAHNVSTVLLGELGLDGRVRPVRGLIPALLAAREAGFARAVVPAHQGAEARLVAGLELVGVNSLADLVEVLGGGPGAALATRVPRDRPWSSSTPDLSEVSGQAEARWALEVAAAGRHHLLFRGAPGVGKTMLAARLPTILPSLTDDEALEVSAVHSLAGDVIHELCHVPPFSDPHHGISVPAMIGGGSRFIRPGAISLAHRGVLFLDEAPEFPGRVLDALRTPLEAGEVLIARADRQARFPARFQLVLAANPCPCGNAGIAGLQCHCTPMAVRRYAERLSGPILDRIDIQHTMQRELRSVSTHAEPGEASSKVAERVRLARERQAHRLRDLPWQTNADVPGSALRRLPEPGGIDLLNTAIRRGQLSTRGVDKVWRVAWTIADLAGSDRITQGQLMTALAMRGHEQVAA